MRTSNDQFCLFLRVCHLSLAYPCDDKIYIYPTINISVKIVAAVRLCCTVMILCSSGLEKYYAMFRD